MNPPRQRRLVDSLEMGINDILELPIPGDPARHRFHPRLNELHGILDKARNLTLAGLERDTREYHLIEAAKSPQTSQTNKSNTPAMSDFTLSEALNAVTSFLQLRGSSSGQRHTVTAWIWHLERRARLRSQAVRVTEDEALRDRGFLLSVGHDCCVDSACVYVAETTIQYCLRQLPARQVIPLLFESAPVVSPPAPDVPTQPRPAPVCQTASPDAAVPWVDGRSSAARRLKKLDARIPKDGLSAFGDYVPWEPVTA